MSRPFNCPYPPSGVIIFPYEKGVEFCLKRQSAIVKSSCEYSTSARGGLKLKRLKGGMAPKYPFCHECETGKEVRGGPEKLTLSGIIEKHLRRLEAHEKV